MKRINFTVEFTVDLPDDVDPDYVTFDIPIEQVGVETLDSTNACSTDNDRIPGASLVAYTAQEIWEEA